MVSSVRDKGVTQPAIVRPREDGGYEIVSGHRRQKASELAGFVDMPCIVRDLTDEQAITQMVEDNKDHAETIMGNMDSIVFLGGREASTLKDISENWLGKATISMQTDSRTRGQSESYGLNTQRLGRELLTTSEITTMPGNKCLLQLRGLPPFFSPKYDLKQHPNYRYTAEHDSKRNAFHLERLTSRRLRLKPEEEYTVYEVDTSDEDADILNYDDLDSADDFV